MIHPLVLVVASVVVAFFYNFHPSNMPGEAHLPFSMALLVAAGGLMGYAKAKSVPSLAAGLGFGALFTGAGYLIQSGKEKEGHDLATVLSVALTAVMGARALRTRKLVPAGIVASAAAISTVYEAQKSIEWHGGL
ncbi:mitochondrial transmembrane protein 14C-like protein [Andalucia godoyi]|uniref:Mitochondrial transmembrane protein 14C-like protein n=1 Tax=Andalucia godoyi TaxID=505711 RepID=A0A8K0AK62_ANDGO|nr:mitochondrial transmembrane protein 14C-like protein [Andalucia godoyi]|eukprot:ANDGO_03154.mRNA.1 mitochondrial transmembrane protein 14C-like protein